MKYSSHTTRNTGSQAKWWWQEGEGKQTEKRDGRQEGGEVEREKEGRVGQ